MSELFDLYKRNFPYCVREDAYAEYLLESEENKTVKKRNDSGELIGAAVVHKNNILMLCVDKNHRRKGLGSQLLAEAEEIIRQNGYSEATVGAGDSYLMPGVPSGRPVVDEELEPDRISSGIESDGVDFVKKRGYFNRWDCNCFDMKMSLADFAAEPSEVDGINFRWATVKDIPEIIKCIDDANKGFSKFYSNESIYGAETKKVLVAQDGDEIVGAVMVNYGVEGDGLGSIGCTAVKHSHRGKKIATNLVIMATESFKRNGMSEAFLGYTYTGLDKMYGAAGYKISTYYFMAKKTL